jgi:hypothetical protein
MFEYGNQLPGEVKPALDQYSATAQQGYASDMANSKRDALRELDQEIAGGDQQGRLAGYQHRALDQGYSDEADRNRADIGLKRAELGETLRQRGQNRGWQVEDRDLRLSRLRQQAEDKRQEEFSNQSGGAIGQILGEGSKLLGSAAVAAFL